MPEKPLPFFAHALLRRHCSVANRERRRAAVSDLALTAIALTSAMVPVSLARARQTQLPASSPAPAQRRMCKACAALN